MWAQIVSAAKEVWMPTEKKRAQVEELTERLRRSQVVILTDYRGLQMKDLTTLRRSLERAGGGYHVVKNTLLNRALDQAGIVGLASYIEGPLAVALGYEDAVTLAKALREQKAAFPTVQIKGGWMAGQALSPAQVEALATLPPRPILLGQLVGMVQWPVAGLIGTLSGVLQQLLYVLETRSRQGAEAAA